MEGNQRKASARRENLLLENDDYLFAIIKWINKNPKDIAVEPSRD